MRSNCNQAETLIEGGGCVRSTKSGLSLFSNPCPAPSQAVYTCKTYTTAAACLLLSREIEVGQLVLASEEACDRTGLDCNNIPYQIRLPLILDRTKSYIDHGDAILNQQWGESAKRPKSLVGRGCCCLSKT